MLISHEETRWIVTMQRPCGNDPTTVRMRRGQGTTPGVKNNSNIYCGIENAARARAVVPENPGTRNRKPRRCAGFVTLRGLPRRPSSFSMATGVVAVIAQHRVVTYAVVSIGLLLGVIARAVERHSNFYSIAVDLSRNSRSVLVSPAQWLFACGR